MYKKFNDFTIFEPPDVSDYLVGYRELGGEFRSTIGEVSNVIRKIVLPTFDNTIFVNISGNDSDAGNSETTAFRTIKRAAAKALEISRNITNEALDYEIENGWGISSNTVTIFVRGGDYVEDNPIYVPPNTIIVSEENRSVNFIAKNKFYDAFWVNNKSSIQGFNFSNLLKPAYAIAYPEFAFLNNSIVKEYPSERISDAASKAYTNYILDPINYPATKDLKKNFLNFSIDNGDPIFDPFKIAFSGKYFRDLIGNDLFYNRVEFTTQKEFWETRYYNLSVQKPFILESPYIYNIHSRNISTSENSIDAGGTVHIDGDKVNGPLRSMFIDSCLHFNQGGTGIHVTNNANAFVKNDTSFCCSESVLVDNGSNCIINGSNYSFGLSGLVALGHSPKATMLGTLKTPIYSDIETNKLTITNLGSPLFSSLQKFPNDKKPYIGQIFQIVDKNYTENTTSGIHYLSAQNSGTFFVVTSASDLRPASLPYDGYECDIIIEYPYLLSNDESVNSKTYLPENIQALNEGSNILFYSQSSIIATSQLFYHIGTGVNFLSATPQSGALFDSSKEINHDKIGRILCNSINQNGDYNIGEHISFDRIKGIGELHSINSETLNSLSANIGVLNVEKYVNGELLVKDLLNVEGDFNVNGKTELTGDTNIIGNTDIEGNVHVKSNTSNATLRVTQLGSGDVFVVENNINSKPFIVNKAGNVGIGSINTGYKLTVSGSISASDYLVLGDRIELNKDNINHSWIGSYGTILTPSRMAIGFESDSYGDIKSLKFRTNSENRIFIDYYGNVGIGANDPNEKLTVIGSISSTENIYCKQYYGDGSKLTGIGDNFKNTFLTLTGGDLTGPTTLSTFSYDTAFKITQSGPGHAFAVEDLNVPNYLPFIITSEGNVGIKNTSPLASLHVNSKDAIVFPVGNSSERVNIKGALRFNSDKSLFEGYNGSYWNQINETTYSEIISDVTVGSISASQIIPIGTTFQKFVEKILVKTFYPTLIDPSVSLTSNLLSAVEVGTRGITLNMNFNKGSINGLSVLGVWNPQTFQNYRSGNASVYTFMGNNNGTSSSYTIENQIINDDVNIFNGNVIYNVGPQPKDSKNNNYGTPLNSNSGNPISSSLTIYGRRKAFYGVDNYASNSEDIRSLSNNLLNPSNGSTFTINIPAGATDVVFAYPSTLRNVSSVRYVDGLNAEIKGIFTQTSINVEGLNGYTAIPYKVYKYTPALPFNAPATYTITI